MTSARTGQAQTRQRIGAKVRSRRDHGTPTEWDQYLGHAMALPKLLHQHGLHHTWLYLNMLADYRGDLGAKSLLIDWSQVANADDPLAPAMVHWLKEPPPTHVSLTTWRLAAEKQAHVEALQFKRYAEILQNQAPTDNKKGQTASGAITQLPAWWSHTSPQTRAHLGLLLRFGGSLPTSQSPRDFAKTYRTQHVQAMVEHSDRQWKSRAMPDNLSPYLRAIERRERDLTLIGARCFAARLTQRLYTALGERGVWETYVDLHPTHGTPMVRGSAIKSTLKRYLIAKSNNIEDPAQRAASMTWIDHLLGAGDERPSTMHGALQIHDAWWQPSQEDPSPLVGDVDTPHHPAYYQGSQEKALPTDSPEPQPQLAVRGQFLFAIGLAGDLPENINGLDLLDTVHKWLTEALTHEGVGAAQRISAGRFGAFSPKAK